MVSSRREPKEGEEEEEEEGDEEEDMARGKVGERRGVEDDALVMGEEVEMGV